MTVLYRAHPTKRLFDALVVVPAYVLIDQGEHLVAGVFLPLLGVDRLGLHPAEESLRGRHYRWPEWIRICTDNNLTRSMSAKGCSPDNAAAEGFFGRLKQEFFHKRSFAGVSMDGFINMLNDYMVWYRDRRIKTEFGMSIMDRRRELGLVA